MSVANATVKIEATLTSPMATVQFMRIHVPEALDTCKRDDETMWVDLCLTPRLPDAIGWYPERWSSRQYEPLGEVFVIPPGETLRVRCQAGTQTTTVCKLDAALVEQWFETKIEWTEARLRAGLRISDRSIRGLMFRLTREVCHPGFASEALLELMAPQLAIEIGRLVGSVNEERRRSGLAAWRLRLIDERLKEVGKAPSLTELAALCNLSVRQLSRGFRASKGCSIGRYIEQHRIETAKRLLTNGKSVKSVAYSMGFSSPSSFSFAFRRITGCTPAEYRDKV
jgi:AraC family transcriptional regulator